jgi:hypothetical protein
LNLIKTAFCHSTNHAKDRAKVKAHFTENPRQTPELACCSVARSNGKDSKNMENWTGAFLIARDSDLRSPFKRNFDERIAC